MKNICLVIHYIFLTRSILSSIIGGGSHVSLDSVADDINYANLSNFNVLQGRETYEQTLLLIIIIIRIILVIIVLITHSLDHFLHLQFIMGHWKIFFIFLDFHIKHTNDVDEEKEILSDADIKKMVHNCFKNFNTKSKQKH